MPLDWNLISSNVLESLDLDTLLANIEQRDCHEYSTEISRLQKDATRWSPAQIECLCFIEQALTMMLKSNRPNKPYGPMFEIDQRRSAIPADFPKAELLSLQDWVISIQDPELRARMLDILWVQGKSFQAAKSAVEAYLASALQLEHPEHWPPCFARAERALRLAASLGKGALDLKAQALVAIESMLGRYRGTDPLYLSKRLIQLLLEFKHGDAGTFATFAEHAAQMAEASEDFWRAKDYKELAAACYRSIDDTEAEGTALCQAAECLVKESEAAYKQLGRGAITAASLLSDAVEAMRQAPGGRERAAELHERLLIVQKESIAELKSFSTTIDTSELVHRALSAVRGKTFHEAVIQLCSMAKPPLKENLRKEVHEQARVAVFASLFSSEVMNSRGRVVARVPGLMSAENDPDETGLRWRMFRHARLARTLSVQAMLNPARHEVYTTHAPDQQDIAALIQYSPWVPPGHGESLARALLAGFQGDMLVAGHLVPPQLEALIRNVVELTGGSTSMLEPGGVQPERPLSVLLETPEVLKVFGADGVFELLGLLVDPLGTNLRNEVAHGLLDDSGMFGTDVIYAWWLLLRFCALTSKMTEREMAAASA